MEQLHSPLADPAVQRLFGVLPGARLVGGCVRDMLAGRPSHDVDLATPLSPDATAALLGTAGIRVIPTGLAHGTVTAMVGSRPYEITTLRRDVLTDGRHAEVAWTEDWREDAARRDFTINAMSMAADGVLHDYFGGEADLRAGRVRFVGEAGARMAEDYLRLLRFFRFQARYGVGAPDPDAVAAVRAGLAGLARLSAERVWSELKRILAAPAPDDAVRLMAETGVLDAAVPEGARPVPLAHLPADAVLRMAALLVGDRAAFASRLKLSLAEASRLRSLEGAPPQGNDDAMRRQLADASTQALIGRSWLAGQPEAVRERVRALGRPVFPLEGRHVLSLGVAPGRLVGELLAQVRAWWLAGGCVAGLDACVAELGRVAAQPSLPANP